MSRQITGLVDRGLVARKTCSKDRRQCALVLTPRGRAKLARARQANLDALADEIAHLDPATHEKIADVMQTFETVFSRRPGAN